MDQERERNLRSLAGWEQGLTILSMERWAPFLFDLGVPGAVAADPEPARNEARTLLRRLLAPTPGDRVGSAIVGQDRLREGIARMAGRYGQGPIEALALWIEQLIADLRFVESLAGWLELLRGACSFATPEQPIEPLPVEIDGRVRDTTGPFLNPAQHRARKAAIDAAAALPSDGWEQELEGLVQRQAGLAAALGPVEMSADLVGLLIGNRRTLSALEALERALSSTERDALVTWAARQRTSAAQSPLAWIPPLSPHLQR